MTSDPLAALSPSVLQGNRQVFDRYRLERLVGRGGMGVVWRAHDTKLERTVALKFLPDVLFLDLAARDDLKRETRRCLELTHPHVVRIHDFIEDEEMAAIVMEYVDGPTLSQLRIEQPSRHFQPDELATWTAALCAALDYAHDAGRCVHRDLKPGNLMVNSRGVLKITDFGIACSLQNTAARVSAWSSSGGTLGYMSPQQLLGELAAPSDDIYSVGATLYELLTGKPPFFGGDLTAQIREIVPDSMSERRRKLGLPGGPLPAVWEQVIAACLAKHPRQRPASAGEIARRLGLNSTPLAEIGPALGESLPPTLYAPLVTAAAAWPSHLAARLTKAGALLWRFRWPLSTALAVASAFVLAARPHPATPPSPTAAAQPPVPTAAAIASTQTSAVPVPTPNPAPEPTTPPASASSSPPPTGDQLALVAPVPTTSSSPAAESAAGTPAAGRMRLETVPDGIPFQVFASAYETPISQVMATGETPTTVEIPPGGYRVVFAPAGGISRTVSVQVPGDEMAVFQATFPHGTLKVRCEQGDTEIDADGRDLGAAPLEVALLPGPHEITAHWHGRDARPRTVQLADAGEAALDFDFRTGSSPSKSSHHPKKKEDDSVLSKIGRTFKTIFAGEDKTKKP